MPGITVPAGFWKHISFHTYQIRQQVKKGYYSARNLSIGFAVQNMYSVDNRKWEPVLKYCEETDKAFIPWFPLNAGNVEGLEKIKKVADTVGATTHQVALSWLLHHSPNILLIPGTSSVKHLEENIATSEISLDEAALKALEEVGA